MTPTPDPLRVALLRIFDLAVDRPDIRAVVTAALAAQPAPPLDAGEVERQARLVLGMALDHDDYVLIHRDDWSRFRAALSEPKP